LESIPKNYFCFYDVGHLRLREWSSTMFISTDVTFLQDGQIHSLTERGKSLSVVLHVLQVFEDA
jgi:hypothetical protein